VTKEDYEDPRVTVHAHVDDVCVKKQKDHRNRKQKPATTTDASAEPVSVEPVSVEPVSTEPASAVPALVVPALVEVASSESSSGELDLGRRRRPLVSHSVAHVEHAGQDYTIVGDSVLAVVRLVLAVLLQNNLFDCRWLFFTDGQRHLQNTILAFFAWRKVRLMLDWFHVVKKLKEELSLASKGSEVRNRHVRGLARLLWFGLVDESLAYLQQIPAVLKQPAVLKRLAGYFERNRKGIPCYALRRELKLPNSSNPVERTNNLVTSQRQKKSGMSWSQPGSLAMTALTAVTLNGQTQTWLKTHQIPLAFRQAA
jgi:hypothetical protein